MRTTPDEIEVPNRRRSVIVGVVTLLLLVLIFAGIFPQFADYGAAWDAATELTGLALTVVIAATLVNIAVYAWPLHAALPELPFRQAFIVRQTAFAISNAVPAGGAVGPATAYAMLARYGIERPRATAAVGINAAWNILITLVIPIFAVIALTSMGTSGAAGVAASVIGLAIGGGIVAAIVAALRSEAAARSLGARLNRPVAAVARLLRRDDRVEVGGALARFRASTANILSARWLSITATNLLIHVASFVVLWAVIVGIVDGSDDTIGVVPAIAAFALARVATLVPITPGGLGTVDGAMATLLSGFGLSGGAALAAVLIWRVATFLPQVLLGLGTFFRWKRDVSGAPA